MQGDGSWKVASDHTLRGGFLVQRERVTGLTQALAERTESADAAMAARVRELVALVEERTRALRARGRSNSIT